MGDAEGPSDDPAVGEAFGPSLGSTCAEPPGASGVAGGPAAAAGTGPFGVPAAGKTPASSGAAPTGVAKGGAGTAPNDVDGGRSTRVYEKADLATPSPFPAFDLVESPGSYFDFMGVPMETSLGCVHGCAFCLVHSTQEHLNYRSAEQHDASVPEGIVGPKDNSAIEL